MQGWTRQLFISYITQTHSFFPIPIQIPWHPHPHPKNATTNFLQLENSAPIRYASSSISYLSNATTVDFRSARNISRLMFTSVRNMMRENIIESLPTVCPIHSNHTFVTCTHVAFSIRPSLQHPSCSSSWSRPERPYGHAFGEGVLRCDRQSQVKVISRMRKRKLQESPLLPYSLRCTLFFYAFDSISLSARSDIIEMQSSVLRCSSLSSRP